MSRRCLSIRSKEIATPNAQETKFSLNRTQVYRFGSSYIVKQSRTAIEWKTPHQNALYAAGDSDLVVKQSNCRLKSVILVITLAADDPVYPDHAATRRQLIHTNPVILAFSSQVRAVIGIVGDHVLPRLPHVANFASIRNLLYVSLRGGFVVHEHGMRRVDN